MKVEKEEFDALLNRLTKADPAKRQDIKTADVKPGKIIPPAPRPQWSGERSQGIALC
jgi:hypothetical protein